MPFNRVWGSSSFSRAQRVLRTDFVSQSLEKEVGRCQKTLSLSAMCFAFHPNSRAFWSLKMDRLFSHEATTGVVGRTRLSDICSVFLSACPLFRLFNVESSSDNGSTEMQWWLQFLRHDFLGVISQIMAERTAGGFHASGLHRGPGPVGSWETLQFPLRQVHTRLFS